MVCFCQFGDCENQSKCQYHEYLVSSVDSHQGRAKNERKVSCSSADRYCSTIKHHAIARSCNSNDSKDGNGSNDSSDSDDSNMSKARNECE